MIKYKQGTYGTCPRYLCKNQALLPIGISDQPFTTSLKLFCPLCQEAYNLGAPQYSTLDGAYFGTTFAHLFLQSHPSLVPMKSNDHYVPRIFGFKLKNTNSATNSSNNNQLSSHPPPLPISDYQTSRNPTTLVSTNSNSFAMTFPTLV